jgi:hypothetical protein
MQDFEEPIVEVMERNTTQHTSFSQMSSYWYCSMKFYFERVLGWERRPSLPMAAGSAGHTVIEWNARKKIATGIDGDPTDFLDLASDTYDSETYDLTPADLQPGEDIGKNKDAHIALLKYYRHGVAPKRTPVATELEFNVHIEANEVYEYPLRIVTGRIDLIDPAIIDNKFASRAKTQADVDLSDQLSLYDYALQRHDIVAPDLGFDVYLQANTKDGPRVQLLRRSPTLMTPEARANRFERLKHKFRTTQRAIDASIFIPTDDPKKCGRCDYRDRCQYSLVKDDYIALAIKQQETR